METQITDEIRKAPVRDEMLTVRFTRVEREMIDAAARRSGLRRSTFCREVLVDLARAMLVAYVLDFKELEEEEAS